MNPRFKNPFRVWEILTQFLWDSASSVVSLSFPAFLSRSAATAARGGPSLLNQNARGSSVLERACEKEEKWRRISHLTCYGTDLIGALSLDFRWPWVSSRRRSPCRSARGPHLVHDPRGLVESVGPAEEISRPLIRRAADLRQKLRRPRREPLRRRQERLHRRRQERERDDELERERERDEELEREREKREWKKAKTPKSCFWKSFTKLKYNLKIFQKKFFNWKTNTFYFFVKQKAKTKTKKHFPDEQPNMT